MSFWNGNNYDDGYDQGYDDGHEGRGKDYTTWEPSVLLRESCGRTYCEGYDEGYHDGCLDRNREDHDVYGNHDDD